MAVAGQFVVIMADQRKGLLVLKRDYPDVIPQKYFESECCSLTTGQCLCLSVGMWLANEIDNAPAVPLVQQLSCSTVSSSHHTASVSSMSG